MIQLTPHMRILVATKPADFRKGIDGLAALCRKELRSDPMSGTVFVFRNRRGTAIKLIVYDGQGFWLCQKRLSKGRFNWWPTDGNSRLRQLAVHELQLLIWNGQPLKTRVAPLWKPVEQPAEKF